MQDSQIKSQDFIKNSNIIIYLKKQSENSPNDIVIIKGKFWVQCSLHQTYHDNETCQLLVICHYLNEPNSNIIMNLVNAFLSHMSANRRTNIKYHDWFFIYKE